VTIVSANHSVDFQHNLNNHLCTEPQINHRRFLFDSPFLALKLPVLTDCLPFEGPYRSKFMIVCGW
jgi:hypothetical protein